MNQVFAPGCALMIYKPHLARKLQDFLGLGEHLTCCRHEPCLPSGTRVVNVCAGCDRRYRSLYEGVSTISLWEMLTQSDGFPFPDYGGAKMTIHDPCPVRTEKRVHDAVREVLGKMRIEVVEPLHTREHAFCCGDDFYGKIGNDALLAQMKRRAGEMPCEDVVVYCVSCVKAMHNGGKKPRYIIDLLFGEETTVEPSDPGVWHAALDAFIEAH